jgi:hypothetical protein
MLNQVQGEFLILAAVSIAVIHSFAPDHYIPIVTIARMKGWGAGKAILLSGIAATIHVTSSVILSIGVFKGLDLAGYAELLEEFSPLMLVAFGMLYALISILRPHRHVHTLSTSTLLLVVGLSPCVPLIPVVLAASTLSQAVMIAILFSMATILTIVTLTYVSYRAFRPPKIGDREDVVAGIIVAAVGLITYILEGKHGLFRKIQNC